MKNRTIKNLGEIALCVKDLDAMQQFYEDVVRLEFMKRFPKAAFFKIAEGYGGHTQILALFDRTANSERPEIAKSTVDHIAFGIDLEDFESEKKRLEDLGLNVTTSEHEWVHWRSLYFPDPEGNLVEFVCYDATI